MMFRSALIAGALVVVAAVCSPAGAHVRTTDGSWLFAGSTYTTDQDRAQSPNRGNRSDPITVIWTGPTGATATVGRVMDHTEEHWTDRRIPGKYPRGRRMRPRDFAACTDPQLAWFRDGPDENSGGWTQSTGYMSTNGACTNQYHIRLWSSARHGFYFPAYESEWVFAPIHHERVRWNPLLGPFTAEHDIDRSWDQIRSSYIHALKPHCRERGWAVHPESATRYEDYPNSGTISRISFRHRFEGCDGA